MAPTTLNSSSVQVPSNSSSTVFEPISSIESEENRPYPGGVADFIEPILQSPDEVLLSAANYRDNANTSMECSEIELSHIQVSENRNDESTSQEEARTSSGSSEGPPRAKRRCTERRDSWNAKKNTSNVPEVGIYGNKLVDFKSKQKESSCWEKFTKPSTQEREKQIDISVPKAGTPVTSNMIKQAGPYLLGPLIGTSPVKSIVQCLARRMGTDKFYTIKILTLKDESEHETQDDRQGKMLLHAEYSLLSLLQNQDGVVHHHGFFKVIILKNINCHYHVGVNRTEKVLGY